MSSGSTDVLSLAGKVALVTGASRNLGAAAVYRLAQSGADVVLVSRESPEVAQSVAQRCQADFGVRTLVVRADIGDVESVRQAVEEANSIMGRIDIALECAAQRPHNTFLDISVDEWNSVISSNLSAAFYFARALLPSMIVRGWGRLIHVSGVDGWTGYPNRAHNIAAKAGLHGLTKALAIEMAPHGITVNTIVPGAFRTQRDPRNYPGWDDEEWAQRIPVRRMGDPEKDFATMSAFLASDASGFITGQAMHLNGGQWMF